MSEENIFLEINQLETGIACGGHVIEDLPYIVPTKLRFIWLSSFRKEDFFKNQLISNKICLLRPCFLTDRDKMGILYIGPSIDASYHA